MWLFAVSSLRRGWIEKEKPHRYKTLLAQAIMADAKQTTDHILIDTIAQQLRQSNSNLLLLDVLANIITENSKASFTLKIETS